MTEQQAITVVERERKELDIDPGMSVHSAEKAIVEFIKDRTGPGRVDDRIAWIVELTSDMGFVQVHVDDSSGKVLEVHRSA